MPETQIQGQNGDFFKGDEELQISWASLFDDTSLSTNADEPTIEKSVSRIPDTCYVVRDRQNLLQLEPDSKLYEYLIEKFRDRNLRENTKYKITTPNAFRLIIADSNLKIANTLDNIQAVQCYAVESRIYLTKVYPK